MTLARRNHPNPAREQWQRVARWESRLQDALREGNKGVTAEDVALVVLHYCWTMRDWLRNSLHGPLASRAHEENAYTVDDVTQLFASPELRACSIVANAAKHLDLTRMGVGHWDGTILREYAGAAGPRTVVIAEGKYELSELATECFRQIRGFLESRGWSAAV